MLAPNLDLAYIDCPRGSPCTLIHLLAVPALYNDCYTWACFRSKQKSSDNASNSTAMHQGKVRARQRSENSIVLGDCRILLKEEQVGWRA